MKSWKLRPKEEAHLLNPAFCSTLITGTVSGYMENSSTGLPFPLLFMILPLILHRKTRERLPRSISTSMAEWLHENIDARILFVERLISLKPYTQEALLFGWRQGWLDIHDQGTIKHSLVTKNIDKIKKELNEETRDCFMKSLFLGRWFSYAGNVQTIMTQWGIRP